MASVSLLPFAPSSSYSCCPACQPTLSYSSCLQAHSPLWISAEEGEYSNTEGHLYTGTVVVSRCWASSRIFFNALLSMHPKQRGRVSKYFWRFLAWLFGFWKQEVIKDYLFNDLFASQEASPRCGKVKYINTYIILVLPCSRQHVGYTTPKLDYQIFWGFLLGEMVLLSLFVCWFYFVFFTIFQCCFATFFTPNAKSTAGQADF